MTTLDLGPAAREVSRLLDGIDDDQLTASTPCEDYVVGDLLDHFMGLTIAFTDAATNATEPASDGGPAEPSTGSVDNLHTEWRIRLPEQLDRLVEAWSDPEAWDGVATAGGVAMPAEIMGMVALDELVLHGWDLARGTGQDFTCDEQSAAVVHEFTSMSAAPEEAASREGLFGPVIEVPAGAPLFDRALGLSGRDPGWRA